jgi:hypothetical protein
MTAVFFDSSMLDDDRRRRLFAGDLFIYSPTPPSLELCAFARELATAAFAPYDPRDAQHHLESALGAQAPSSTSRRFTVGKSMENRVRPDVLGTVECRCAPEKTRIPPGGVTTRMSGTAWICCSATDRLRSSYAVAVRRSRSGRGRRRCPPALPAAAYYTVDG